MNVQKTKPIRIDKRTVIVPIGKKCAWKNVRWNQLHHGHGVRTILLDSEEKMYFRISGCCSRQTSDGATRRRRGGFVDDETLLLIELS